MRRIGYALLVAALLGAALPADARGPESRRGGRRPSGASALELIPPDAVVFVVTGAPGESNDAGSNGAPAVTTTELTDYRACQQRSDLAQTPRFELARENYATGCWSSAERPSSGTLAALRARMPVHTASLVDINCGVAGSDILDWWDVGSGGAQANYTICQTRLLDAWNVVQASPSTYGSPSGLVVIVAATGAFGENDQGTAEGTFRTNLDAMVAQFGTDARALTGQTFAPRWIFETQSAWASLGGEAAPTGPALARTAAVLEDPLVFGIGPTYAHEGETSSPYLHKEPANHRLSGELRGRAIYEAIFGGSSGSPRIVSSAAVGTALTITFDRDVVIDNAVGSVTLGAGTGGASAAYGCPAHPNGAAGLEVLSDATPPTLSGCVASARDITCTMSTYLDPGDNPRAAVAWSATPPTNVYGCQTGAANSYSNVRSTDSPPLYADHTSAAITVQVLGTIPTIASLSQSYGDPPSTFGGPAFLTTETCPTPLVDSTCAIWVRPGASTIAEGAVEQAGDNASTFVVPAIQVLSRALIAAGGSGRIGIVHQAFPGVRTSFHDTAQIISDLDDLAALAAAQGYALDVRIFSDNGGGFQHQELGDPFATWSDAIELQRAAVAAHVVARVAAAWPGYAGAGPVDVAFNDGSLHAAGGTDDVWEVHPYSAAFDAYEDADHSSCYHTGFVDLQPAEGIHPTLVGSTELGDQQARCWFRILQDGSAVALRATAVVAISPTQLRVTYTVPCRVHGGCETDPPLELNTADQPARTSVGDVVTWGVHAQLASSLLTLPAASTFTADPCPSPSTSCSAVITFAAPLPDFDLITFCDTAEGPDGNAVGMGGCNVFSGTTETWLNDSTAAGDWQQNSQIAATSFDGGLDGGPADATPDGGVEDAAPDASPDAGPDAGPDGGAGDAGVTGYYADLDSDDYVTMGSIATFQGDAQHSRCYWFRFVGATSVNEFVGGLCDTGDRGPCTYTRVDDFREYVSSSSYIEWNDQWIAADTWHHWCAIYDYSAGSTDAERLRGYGDGARMQAVAASVALPTTLPTLTTPDYAIGNVAAGGTTTDVGPVRIACVAEWDVALSRDEVLREYHNPCDTLVQHTGTRAPEHFWRLSGDFIDTGATGGADGTDQGDTTFGTPIASAPAGYYADTSHVAFDGSDDLQACGAFVAGGPTELTVVAKFRLPAWPASGSGGCVIAGAWDDGDTSWLLVPDNDGSNDVVHFYYETLGVPGSGRFTVGADGAGDGEEVLVAFAYDGGQATDATRLVARYALNGAASWTAPTLTYSVATPTALGASSAPLEIGHATFTGANGCAGAVSLVGVVVGDGYTGAELDSILAPTGAVADPSTWTGTAPTILVRQGDSAGDTGTTVVNAGSSGATNDCTLSNGAAITAGGF